MFNHPQIKPEYTKTRLDISGIKAGTLNFFRAVFINTREQYMLKSLRQPKNGIWQVNDEESSIADCEPLGQSLLDDLKMLLDDTILETKTSPDQLEPVIQAVTLEDGSERPLPASQAVLQTRRYVYTQVVGFFIDFARALPLNTCAPDEQSFITDVYERARQVAKEALDSGTDRWDEHETQALKSLVRVVEQFVAGSEIDGSPVVAQVAGGRGLGAPINHDASAWTAWVGGLLDLMKFDSKNTVAGQESRPSGGVYFSAIAMTGPRSSRRLDEMLQNIGIMNVVSAQAILQLLVICRYFLKDVACDYRLKHFGKRYHERRETSPMKNISLCS